MLDFCAFVFQESRCFFLAIHAGAGEVKDAGSHLAICRFSSLNAAPGTCLGPPKPSTPPRPAASRDPQQPRAKLGPHPMRVYYVKMTSLRRCIFLGPNDCRSLYDTRCIPFPFPAPPDAGHDVRRSFSSLASRGFGVVKETLHAAQRACAAHDYNECTAAPQLRPESEKVEGKS